MTAKLQSMKEGSRQTVDFIKIKDFCSSKDTQNEKTIHRLGEKICKLYLIKNPQMNEELSKLNKETTQMKETAKNLNRVDV